MIEWEQPQQDRQTKVWSQRSISPRGYVMTMVPYVELVHFVALYTGDPIEWCAQIRDVNRWDKDAKKKAAEEARAACQAHADRQAGTS